MPKDMKDIQKLIEERASKKLKKDLFDLQRLIRDHPLLKANDSPKLYELKRRKDHTGSPDTDKYEGGSLAQIFYTGPYDSFEGDNNYIGQLYRYWLPEYIERESAEFLDKVDKLREDIELLFETKADRGEADC